MSRPRGLLLDEMFSARIAIGLRDRGHDVIAVVEDLALVASSDGDLLVAATAQDRCIVTAKVRDFAALNTHWASTGRTHGGIVHVVSSAFTQDRSYVGAVVTALDAAFGSGELPAPGGELFLRR